MKEFARLLLAAIIGSLLTIVIFEWFYKKGSGKEIVRIEEKRSSSTQTPANLPEGLNFIYASEKSMPAVVNIKAIQTKFTREDENFHYYNIPEPFRDFFDEFFRDPGRNIPPEALMASGSGVIISADGYIVTNNHVILGSDDIEVSLNDNRIFKAELIGSDPSTDLAVLKIEEKNLVAITIGNSDDLRVGEWVLAVGNPFNLSSTVTAGIVSAKARNIQILQDKYAVESFIQSDAAVNPGNSGGALVNVNGELVGINTAIASPTGTYAGYAFSVPSNIVKKVLEDILKYGVVQRGYLGVNIRAIDKKTYEDYKLKTREGVFIEGVLENGAADDAGVKPGDVIIQIENKKINSAAELQEVIARQRPGDKVKVVINRQGKVIDLTAKLENTKGTSEVIKKTEKSAILELLGVELEELSDSEKKKLNIKTGVKVTDLSDGKLKETGMRKGFIILSIDGQAVSNVNDVIKILENKKGGVMLEGIYPGVKGRIYYAFGL